MATVPGNWDQKFLDMFDKLIKDAIVSLHTVPPFATGGLVTQGSVTGRFPTPPPGGFKVKNSGSGITSTGMGGFSEAGEPGNWDMAVGEIYGYRWWKMEVPASLAGYTDNSAGRSYVTDSRLMGANNHRWDAGTIEASCTNSGGAHRSWDDLINDTDPLVHEPPEYRVPCGCGFWAYFDKDLNVSTVLGGMHTPQPSFGYNKHTVWIPVLGVVKGTGRVIIGTKGFRCQYAEIVGLCVSDKAKENLSWEITGRGYRRRSRGYDYMFHAFGNSPGWYSDDGTVSQDTIHPVKEAERLRRYAAVEALLSVQYPDARIFSDQSNMVKYFPPDPNYAPKKKKR